MDLQLVVEVRHFKISQTIWSESISRRVIVYLEGLYNKNKLVRSAEYKLHDGVVLAIPWSNKLDEFRLHVHYIDDRLKQSLGSCLYQLPTDARFHTNEYDENKLILDLFPDGGKERIGRFLCHVTLQRLYGDDQVRPHPKETQEDYFNRPIPGFKFRRLSKAINWHRLRGIDIEKVVERNDIKTLLTCLDDVTVGDAAEEDVDLRLLRALQLSQFSAQYLLASKKMLEEKKHTIHEALKTFQEEEDVLDIKIAKLKARRKAMNREMEEMDRIADSFTATLKAMKRSEGSSKKKKKHSQDTADLRSSPIRKEYGSESSDDSNNQGVSKKYNHKLIIPKLREGEKNVSKKHRHGEGRYKSASNHPDDDEDEDHEFYGQVVEEVFEVSKKLKDRNGGNDNSKGWKTAKPNASTDGMENDRMIRLGGRSQLQEDEHPEKMFDRAESPPLPQIRPLAQKLTSKADFPKPSSSISIPSNEDRDQVKENLRDNQASNSNIAPNSKVVQVGTRSSMGGTTLTTPAMSVDSLNYTMPEEDNRDSRDIMSNMKGPRGQDDGQDEGFGLHRNQKIFKSLSADPDDEVVQKYRSKYEEDEEEHVGNDKKQFSQTMPVISSQVLVKSSPLTVKSMEPAQPAVQEMSIIVEELDESMRQPVTNPTTNRSSVGASVDTTYENESFVSPTEPVSNTRAETKDSSFDYAQAKNNSPPVEDEDKGADVKRQYGQRFTYKHEEVDDNYFANLDKKEAQNPTKPNQTAPKYPAPAEGKPSTLTVEVDHTQDIIAEPLSTMDSNYAQDFDDSVAGVDTSRSLIVDLDFPMDDDIQPPKSTSKFGSTNSQRNTPNYKSRKYDDFDFEDDDEMNMGTLRPPSTGGGVTIQESLMDISGMESGPPTRDFPSDRSSPSTTVNFGTISSHHPGGTRFRDDQDDDMVLMGTSKFASGTVDSSLKSRLLSTNGTENFEKDSLGGTFGSAGAASAILNGHREDTLSPLNDSITPPPLSGVGPDRGLAEMSYDSVLGDDKSEPLEQPSEYTYDNTFEQVTGETFSVQGDGSTLLNTNNNTMDDSEVQHALNNPTSQSTYNDTVESMEYSLSGPRIEEAGYNTLKSNATGDTATTPLSDSMLLQWNVGKAPIDLLELASAFEVHISAVRLNDFMLSSVSVIAADVEFLDFKSPLSPSITLRQDGIIQPISFFAHLIFDDRTLSMLQDELRELQESVTCQVNIYAITGEDSRAVIGQAIIELWVMIEDSCNILRQEIDIFTSDMTSVIGSAVVDVKGNRLLTRAAEA